jgi:hypothetical protein
MRLHLRPLGVRQYESFHPKLESRSNQNGNPESQQALVTAMLRPRLEAALAKLFAFLTVLTLVWPDWIERFTWFARDAGNGDAEWGIVILFAVLALIAALMARRDYRLAEQGRQETS